MARDLNLSTNLAKRYGVSLKSGYRFWEKETLKKEIIALIRLKSEMTRYNHPRPLFS